VEALDSPAALAAWDAGARLPRQPATASGWIHGDLMPGNLLLREGTLTGILDWGASGVGDAAFDLLAAWTCFGPDGRAEFLGALGATPSQAALARAYAVRKVAWGLPYYRESLPGFARAMAHTLTQIELDRE
jgi:aminoglycoside phosphotransferase (APT) family kinase protein